MLQLPANFGGIEDLVRGINWDAPTLLREINRRATVLSRKGINQNSLVAIAHGGTAHFFADLFAAWKLGATAACLDPTLTSSEIANIVRFAKADAVLVDGRCDLDQLSVPTWCLVDNASCSGDASIEDVVKDGAEPALLLFTSGTTGTPKGVVLSSWALRQRIEANIAAIGVSTLKRTLVALPTFFGHGLIGNSLTALFANGTIILHPRGMPLMNNLGALIDRHSITFMSSVPSLWRLALTCSEPPTKKTLQRVHVGSAPLSASLWSEIAAWADAEVVNCYGITETTNWISGASSRTDGIADGLVGRIWGGQAGVLKDDGMIATKGDGEIVIRSASVMSGYFKRDDLTAAAFKDGWFRTGDHGSIDKDLQIWVTGRLKDEINCGGFEVQPAELDSLLESHPSVAEACAFGIPDPTAGEAVAAAIRLLPGNSISSVKLQSWCAERLRKAAIPEHWFFVSEIPRTPRGKVSRDVVRCMLTEDGANHEAATSTTTAITFCKAPEIAPDTAPESFETGAALVEPPRGPHSCAPTLPDNVLRSANEREAGLQTLWEAIIGIDGVGVTDDFFALGGTSLMAARLMAEIAKRFKVKLPLVTIIDAPTIRQLAHRLDAGLQAGEELVTLRSGGDRQIFFVHDGLGETLLYWNLARRLPSDMSLIAIEPKRLPQMPIAFARIEDIAEHYVSRIRTRQPKGPYLLGGMCSGGVIAYEMAAQLEKAGERVELITLLDAPVPSSAKRSGRIGAQRRRRVMQLLKAPSSSRAGQTFGRVTTIAKKTLNVGRREIYGRLRDVSVRARFALFKRVMSTAAPWPTFIPELTAQDILNSVRDAYVPQPLASGAVVLVRATSGEGMDTPYIEIFHDPDFGWGRLVKQLRIIDVDGGHTSMLQEPFVESLATQLAPYLESKSDQSKQEDTALVVGDIP